jgi:hypothetical protein
MPFHESGLFADCTDYCHPVAPTGADGTGLFADCTDYCHPVAPTGADGTGLFADCIYYCHPVAPTGAGGTGLFADCTDYCHPVAPTGTDSTGLLASVNGLLAGGPPAANMQTSSLFQPLERVKVVTTNAYANPTEGEAACIRALQMTV